MIKQKKKTQGKVYRKRIFLVLLCALLPMSTITADSLPVRLKDIGKIVEVRDNQLIGYGIVVGLRNTGDSRNAGLTGKALGNLLGKMGVPASGKGYDTKNAASVIVTAALPPFTKKGQKIDVVVSSMGDSTSLIGGTLLMTPLRGADMNTYAMAQGPVVVGGINANSNQSKYYNNQSTVGRIPVGGTVEVEVPVTFEDQHNITVVINEPNFITISRVSKAIQEAGFPNAQAIDANTVKIPLEDLESSDLIASIAQIENISVVPDSSSKVVINSRTGTVVIGEMVRLFPVALTHGNISIRISDNAGGLNLGTDQGGGQDISVDEGPSRVIFLNPTATLNSLVNALNEVGVSSKDLISIIQALKEAGALVGDIEII